MKSLSHTSTPFEKAHSAGEWCVGSERERERKAFTLVRRALQMLQGWLFLSALINRGDLNVLKGRFSVGQDLHQGKNVGFRLHSYLSLAIYIPTQETLFRL